ncbi:MAG: fused MFS/spermidine synthase [Lentisphaeria bacterium]|nr:fused MFS/spermidine synthase [Lentisphaeria bacterium]
MNRIVFSLFFASGACGLIYQVVWSRIATHVFGTTTFAVSTVLAAFMAGLALGSYFGGKLCDRFSRHLKLYAYCEIGIGVTGLSSVLLLERLTPLYVWLTHTVGYSFLLFSLIRFGLIFLLILVPTILMGATLPILSRFIIRRFDKLGRLLSSLYAVNTIGGMGDRSLAEARRARRRCLYLDRHKKSQKAG